MEILIPVNYWAVLVCGVAAMVLGSFWYGPLFGKVWMKWSGITEKDIKETQKQGMVWRYILNFVGSLAMAYILAHFLEYTTSVTIKYGLITSFWLWLGFIAPISLGGVLWENKPFKLYFLNNAYNLIILMVMSAILISWPVVVA